ncbi:MAG TPA: histidine phosphatase family protein [Rickettsiales bacterium]|nr:histidine phosphatase family protein [Rickettsiales bacterium]
MKKIYVFRHGQTEANLNKNRDVNPQLTDLGREQAKILGELLKDKNIEYLYSSYLQRANDTAKIVGSIIGINDVEIFGGLEEIDQGQLKNTPKSFKGDMPLNYKDLVEDVNSDVRYIGGESKFEVRKRISSALFRICQQNPHNVIGIGSHAMAMRELLGNFNPTDYAPLKNCEILEFTYDEKNNALTLTNRISHECFTD